MSQDDGEMSSDDENHDSSDDEMLISKQIYSKMRKNSIIGPVKQVLLDLDIKDKDSEFFDSPGDRLRTSPFQKAINSKQAFGKLLIIKWLLIFSK